MLTFSTELDNRLHTSFRHHFPHANIRRVNEADWSIKIAWTEIERLYGDMIQHKRLASVLKKDADGYLHDDNDVTVIRLV